MAGRWKLPECLKTPESMAAFENAVNLCSNMSVNMDANMQTPMSFYPMSGFDEPTPEPREELSQSLESVTRKRIESVKDHQRHLGLPAPHTDAEALAMFAQFCNVPVDYERIFAPVLPAASVSVVDMLRPVASQDVNPDNIDA